jgi:hypothetical protein
MQKRLPLVFLAGCAPSALTPPAHPPFEGGETQAWLAYEVLVPGRDPSDLLPSFEASARAFGCQTEPLGYRSRPTIGNGDLRQWNGISATCEEGTLAIVTLVGERVRIGCTKPTTRAQCDALVQRISAAR